MLTLLSIAAALLLGLLIARLFFAPSDNIKAAPFWLLPYRLLVQKRSRSDLSKEILKYGPICYIWFGFSRRIMINDIELARVVFSKIEDYPKKSIIPLDTTIGKFFGKHVVTVNGDEWRKLRRIMNPAFKIQMIKSFTDGFIENIQAFMDVLDKKLMVAESKKQDFVFEPNELLQKMTLDVLGKAVFNHDFNYLKSEKEDGFITAYNNVLSQLFTPKLALAPWLFSLGIFKEMEADMKRFDHLLYEIIDIRRKQIIEHPHDEPKDLLGLLLKSVDDDVLTDRELRDNVFVFFLAGHETTAGALSSALYAMATNPKEQIKLLEDVKQIQRSTPTYEDTQHFQRIPAFIKEVMRLYSPLAVLPTREALKDEHLGDYVIKKGTRLSVNIDGIHNTHSLWKDPKQFNPARFAQKSSETISDEDVVTSWMAFGAGPRACLGNNFSLLEQKLFLAMFVQRFAVEPCVDYKYRQSMFGIMKPENLKVILKRRLL